MFLFANVFGIFVFIAIAALFSRDKKIFNGDLLALY
ncbi:nucleoside permease NupC [Leuconostoc carnosum]|nr:nucleoside permease NupC [Leuconostoc carnosum]